MEDVPISSRMALTSAVVGWESADIIAAWAGVSAGSSGCCSVSSGADRGERVGWWGTVDVVVCAAW